MSNRNKANRPGTLLGTTSQTTTTATQDPTTEQLAETTEQLQQDQTTEQLNSPDQTQTQEASSTEAQADQPAAEATAETDTTQEPAPAPTEQEQATEINKALATSQPAIEQIDGPVVQDPVAVNVAKKSEPVGRDLGYTLDVRESSFEDIVAEATISNKVNVMIVSEQLQTFVKRFSPQTASSMDQAAKDMAALYSFFLNLLNTDRSLEEFNAQWRLVTETFKAHQNGALSEARLYRGVQHWPRSHEDMKLYQSILNLIRVGNMYDTADLHKQINFRNLEVAALTDQGRGRLMQYYS